MFQIMSKWENRYSRDSSNWVGRIKILLSPYQIFIVYVCLLNCRFFFHCRVSGTILQLETITQSEAMRRRYRYLSHFSLTTTFQVPFHCWLFYVYHHISLLFLIVDLLFFSCVKLIWMLHYLPMPCFHSWMKSRNVKSCGSNLPTRYVYLGSVDIFQPQHKS